MKKFSLVDSLAIWGGSPAFSEALHVGRPNIGDRQRLMERLNDILDRRWLTNDGKYAQEFEQRIADTVGVKHCIATCNGTVALEIAIRALGLKSEVITPSMTFIATAHALQWQGITPVFCDIDPQTYNLDPKCVEKVITPHTTGIIGVHLYGRPCDTEALDKIARRYDLRLLYDAAHAFNCSYKGRIIGSFGDAEMFSFHATKFLNTFEGGAIVTNDNDLAEEIRLMKDFGFSGYDNVICLGTNGKMNEVSAAMGLTGLESLDEFIKINYRNYKKYQKELEGIPGVQLMTYNEAEKCNYQYIILEVDEQTAGIARDQLVQISHAENILVRRYFYPGCHRMMPYRSYLPDTGLMLPETERLANRLLALPTGTSINEEDIEQICTLIRFVINHGNEIRERLRGGLT